MRPYLVGRQSLFDFHILCFANTAQFAPQNVRERIIIPCQYQSKLTQRKTSPQPQNLTAITLSDTQNSTTEIIPTIYFVFQHPNRNSKPIQQLNNRIRITQKNKKSNKTHLKSNTQLKLIKIRPRTAIRITQKNQQFPNL